MLLTFLTTPAMPPVPRESIAISGYFAAADADKSPKFANFAAAYPKTKRMRLSELNTGERAVVVKVLGHGGFRKRIVEMGFIRGKMVTVMLNAPLQDPVKYKIMGYEISLRRSEAAMIEVVSAGEARRLEEEEARKLGMTHVSESAAGGDGMTDERLMGAAMKRSRTINVALVGNPNCGKTPRAPTSAWATTRALRWTRRRGAPNLTATA